MREGKKVRTISLVWLISLELNGDQKIAISKGLVTFGGLSKIQLIKELYWHEKLGKKMHECYPI